MQILLYFVVPLLIILLFCYHWRRRHLYRIAVQLPGPRALPIVGNGLTFLGQAEDILYTLCEMTTKYSMPMRFWFGPDLVIYFTAAEHIEKILSSSKLAYKHESYKVLQIFLGDGLVSSLGGEKYRKHRRLIQPLINIKFSTNCIDIFQRHVDILTSKLETYVDKGNFDIHKLIHKCLVDIIGETILGTEIDAQNGKNMDYIKATRDTYDIGYERLMKPWLRPDVIYNCTSKKKDQDRVVNTTRSFLKDILDKSWSRIRQQSEGYNSENLPIIDQIAHIIQKEPERMNDEDFLYHMYTMYLASEDTMTIISSFLCICFGMYPEYQKRAAEEIYDVLGTTPRQITYDDIVKLKYLDMCIRDVLRLIPIAPIIIRQTVEDFHIDKWTIPKDCGVLISIFDVHRDPEHWENPNHFHPDHFLPEAVDKRHPFAYVPFSAGPRSCVGKILAFVGLRVIMANILQRFEIEADGKFPDIKLRADITVRSVNGYDVRIKRRKWV